MSSQTLFMLMMLVVVVMAVWSNVSKRNKILCTLWRVNKTRITKWVKMQSRYVVIEGKKCDIIPSCVTWKWWNVGFIHMFFPITVAALDFVYNNRFPIDPHTGKPAVITPEVREAMNKEEWAKSYFKSAKSEAKPARTSMIQQYLPWAAIGLVLVLFWYFNSKMTGFGATLDAVINQMNALVK